MKNTINILDKSNISYRIKDDKIYLDNITLNLYSKNIEGCLDLSMIDNLEKLYCRDNELTEIVCNDNLKELYCLDNELTEMVCNDIYIYNNKYYHNNKEIKDTIIKNNKKLMKTDNKIFIIINNYPYDISNIQQHKLSKKHYYEKYN
jgi:hypothetical protein